LLVLGPSIIVSFTSLATTPVAERYLYLPLAPFSLLVIFLFYKLKEYIKMEQPVLIAMILVIVVFSFLNIYRQGVWQDRISFWTDASKNTRNIIPHINLGMAYIDNNELDEGIEILESSLNSNLKSSSLTRAVAYNNLGIAYLKKGETGKARQVFLNAVEVNPKFYKSYYHIGLIYLSYGLKNHTEKELGIAKDYFLEAIKRKKNYARAYLGLAKIYLAYGEDDKSKRLAGLALKYGLVAPMDQQAKDILNLN
jgi:tetratricopeptide (TPR) repeat protein